jgi:tight adherence protein B
MRAALAAWHEDGADPELEMLSRRIRLGADVADAIATTCTSWGADAERLALIVRSTGRLGGDAPAILEQMAASIHEREAATRGGRAASAGAVLSGRMVAGLPLAFLPLTPMARAPLFDGPGLLFLLTGLAFALGGMWWIRRLVPAAPGEDPAAQVAELTAALVRGGVGLYIALEHVTGASGDRSLDLERRLVRLGSSWATAFERSQDAGLVALAATIQRAERTGSPIAAVLVEFARRRRQRLQLDFEAATKKAPVVMVVPLVLCVLPSFCLLALAPFLRGLTLAG